MLNNKLYSTYLTDFVCRLEYRLIETLNIEYGMNPKIHTNQTYLFLYQYDVST